ncbi:HepT-like ribonuclease domain-containing protein [Bacillus benzoevorans]
MKDMMIHGYFSINYRILWDVVQNKVLTLKTTNPKTSKRGPQRPVISQLFVCCL